jgi:hypothetical protein
VLETSQEKQARPGVKSDTLTFLRELKEAGVPVILTINGEAELVVADATSYQLLLELVDRLETIEAIREGIASVDRGEGLPVEEVFEEIQRKHGISRKG